MKLTPSNIRCPSCQGALQPRILACEDCDLRVEGRFEMNEFASLAPEDLHFLRIFIHSEGRVREMESALGLSYPTIRSRLSALKSKLVSAPPAPNPPARDAVGTKATLDRLERGEISYEEALRLLQKTKKSEPKKVEEEEK